MIDLNNQYSAEEKREIGKAYFFDKTANEERKKLGIKLIVEAHGQKDPEATYLVARFLLDGVLKFRVKNQTEYALVLMCSAANKGFVQARAFLNAYCEARYRKNHNRLSAKKTTKVLVDFDGNPIKVKRKGVFTPVDAVLEHKDGKNVLTLSTNVAFLCDEDIPDIEGFKNAVYRGLLAWEGDYEVFGGQKLSVRVVLTDRDNKFDNLLIIPITEEFGMAMKSVSDVIATKKRRTRINETLSSRRSFATLGLRWTVTSRKYIFMQSENGLFDDYDEIMHVAKHEFGHALGLGDLYCSPDDMLAGVESGTYEELDSFAITDKYYNLVMCDHHGPVSNNDIEMVILAFRDNKMQLFQPGRFTKKISEALGKGN